MAFLRPIFALFARSLREQSRTMFTSVSRAGIVLIILLFIASNQRSFLNRSAPGLEVLMMLAMVNFFTITIFGLSTFPSAITEEKEEETLGLLRMTQLNPLAILLGKSTARLFDGFLLLAVQLPFTMLCITLGGIAQEQIFRTYGILAAYLFLLCNVGLLWSVVCRRSRRAASMTTVTGLAIYLLPLFFIGFFFAVRMGSRVSGQIPVTPWYQTAAEWLYSINPIFDLMKTIMPRGTGLPFPANSIIPSLIIGTVAFGLAWMLFGPCCNNTGEAAPRRVPKAAGIASRRRIGTSRPGRLAIAWKDFHFLNGGFAGLVIRLIAYSGLVGAFLWWAEKVRLGTSLRTTGETLRVFGLMAFSIELGLTGARIFGVERKRKTLGGLFALPLGTKGIIWQKVAGALPVFIPSLGMYFLGAFLVANSGTGQAWERGDGFNARQFLFFASEYALFAVLVTYLSLRMRRAVLASAAAVLFFGNLLVGSLFDGFVRSPLSASVIAGIFAIMFASRIPRRIAAAVAEE